jgi:hypothetical protein
MEMSVGRAPRVAAIVSTFPSFTGGAMKVVRKAAVRWLAVATMCGAGWSPACAGVFSKKDNCDCHEARCEECGRPKKRCFGPPPAPEAGVAFAIPGVVRTGQAVRVNESEVRRALQEAAARQVDREAGERPRSARSTEERLEALEGDVQQLKGLMERLTIAVDKLADELPRK